MADTKISDLPTDITTLADGDKFPVADASALTADTYATALEIKTYANTANKFAAGSAAANSWPEITSGTVLTTPESGAWEYDGTSHYLTTGTGRGAVMTPVFMAVQADFTLSNASGAQNCLTAAADTLTVAGSTSYWMEGQYIINNGTTTHTTAMGFGGTATVTSFEYTAILWTAAANTIATAQSTTHVSGVASKVLNATSTNAWTIIMFKGFVRINAGGTLIPQINFSAAPGGTNLMKVGSYIMLSPMGSNTVVSVGPWA